METSVALAAIAFVGALVNGALGYGFSSVAVPLALLVVENRTLAPAIVLLEVVLNAHVLFINRAVVSSIWRRAVVIVLGLPVGVVFGTTVLTRVDATWLKFGTFVVLLPLVLLQVIGVRRALRAERRAGVALGVGVGALYALTTISGPPLALFLTNQGLARQEFRATLALVRLAASLITVALFLQASLFTADSIQVLRFILPGVLLGVPLGAILLSRIGEETFRRVCMIFDAAIIAFGLSVLLRLLGIINGPLAFLPLVSVVAFGGWALRRHVRGTGATAPAPQSQCATALPVVIS